MKMHRWEYHGMGIVCERSWNIQEKMLILALDAADDVSFHMSGNPNT